MKLSTAALALALAAPLLSGCVLPEDAWMSYQKARSYCWIHDTDDLTPDQGKHLQRPDSKKQVEITESKCLAAFARKNPDEFNAAMEYQAKLDKLPYAPPDAEAIIMDEHGSVIGDAEYYGAAGLTVVH